MTRQRMTRGDITALQAALAAEQAAVYGYGVAGAHLGGKRQQVATADWVAHQQAAGTLSGLLSDAGVTPVPAAVAYQLPRRVTGPTTAAALAAALEDQVTSAYLGLVGRGGDSLRVLGAQRARAAALRAASWRGATEAFPGLPGRD